jgi:hypothetical protein
MTIVSYIILLSLFNIIYGFEKPCIKCKFYIPTIGNNDLGLCKIFKEVSYVDKNIVIHNFAIHCRNNENLCGKDGIFYEPNLNYIDTISIHNDDNNEVTQIKRDFDEVLQKMKKHNTKRIYRVFKK